MNIRTYQGTTPLISTTAFIDDTALVAGDVHIGEHSSIWPMTVVRGDVNSIIIGARTNIQDGSVLHVTHSHDAIPGGHALHIGDNITVGHKVILHGCIIENNCLIGMGAIVMDGAVLQSNVLLAAGSLVPQGKELEGGYLWLGNPARKTRPLRGQELAWIAYSAVHYVKLAQLHLDDCK